MNEIKFTNGWRAVQESFNKWLLLDNEDEEVDLGELDSLKESYQLIERTH